MKVYFSFIVISLALIMSSISFFYSFELSRRIDITMELIGEHTKLIGGVQDNMNGILENQQLLIDALKDLQK